MKESPPTGHLCVAAAPERTTRGSRRQQASVTSSAAAAATTINNSSNHQQSHHNINNNNNTESVNKNHGHSLVAHHDNDSDSEADWDVDVGNLVIDLDADLERHLASPAVTSCAAAATATPPRVSSGKMSSIEHHAVVDKGLKMKIKRKNVGSKLSDIKHEIVKAADAKLAGGGGGGGSGANAGNTNSNADSGNASSGSGNVMPGSVPTSPMDKQKHGANVDSKEKSIKGRGAHKKEKGRSAKAQEPVSNGTQFHPASGSTSGAGAGTGAGMGAGAATTTTIPTSLAHKFTGNVSVDIYPITFNIKKEAPADDPYEFNAKVEDGGRPIGFPVKKIKVEKTETAAVPTAMVTSPSPVPTQDAAVETCCVSTLTDPDCLGPCEPGTAVTLEGIVWQETENGVLVVNVTWRGKTYVGTLLDATKHDWAPPRLNCESPTSEVDVRTPKGRGKRGRAAANAPENLEGTRKLRKGRRNNSGTFTAPPSPAKSDASSQGVKRKGKVADLDLTSDGPKASKRCRSSSRGTPTGNGSSSTESPALIECPEPNCNKKYKHINGLRYHQTHAHQQSNGAEEEGEEGKDPPSSEESGPHSPAVPPAKTDKATTRSKSKKAATSAAGAAANNNHKNVDDGEELLARSSPRKKEEAVANGAGGSSSSVNTGVSGKASQQGLDGGKVGKADKKDGEGHNKKGEKSVNVPIPSSTAVSGGSNNTNNTDESCKTPTSQMFQISGAPIGCLATSGVMAPPVSANPIIVSTGGTSTVTTQLIAGTTVTAVPVSLPTGTTIVSLQQPLDAKVDSSDKGKKAKSDKTDKLKGKSMVVTRAIVPAPATLPVGSHGQLSSGNQHTLISQTSPHTAGLKPIQPKPTIMGEPSVNPALATLAKEKKSKKKKSRDKEQPAHTQTQQQLQQQQQQQSQQQQQQSQQQQQQASQHQGKGSTHSKDVLFIKQEDGKPEPRSVIKTVPSPLKPVGEAGDPRLRDPASLPPELSKQPPAGMPGQQQHPRADPKGETTATTASPNSSSSKGGGSDQRFARPPSSLSINSPLQVSTESRERSGEVQSPAYSDISDESAPMLENETTQPSHKIKEEGEKGGAGGGAGGGGGGVGGGQLDGKVGERQAEDAMAAYNMSNIYHGYYNNQPPYLIPAVQANSSAPPTSAAAAVAAAAAARRTPPIKSAADKELDLSGKSAAAGRKDSDRDGVAKLGESGKDGGSIGKPNSDDSKGVGSNSQPLSDYQMQQHPQQKLMQQHPHQHPLFYYPGYMDPGYMRLVNDPMYNSQYSDNNKHPDDHKAKEAGTDLTKDSSKVTVDKIKTEPGLRGMPTHAQGAPLLTQGGKLQTERSASASASASSAADKGALVSSKPPALISEKERKLRELEQRASVKDASLKEKQNENRQILKENIALKSQMAAEGRHPKPPGGNSSGGSGAGGNMPPGSQFENNGLTDRQRGELQLYYMYQRADEERRKFYDPYGHHAAAQQQQQQQQAHAAAAHRTGRPGDNAPTSQHARGADHRDSPSGKAAAAYGKSDDGPPRDGARSRDPSETRASMKDPGGEPGKHGPEQGGKHKEVGGGVGDDKRPNASPSPRNSTTPKTSKDGGATLTSMHGFPAQYLSHAYIQAPHYPPQIAFDANHPMYRGVSPVIGYGSPAYIHPAPMRYHMSPGLEDGPDKAKLLSPGGAPGPEVRKGPADHPGKALELLQQHASHYNNFGGQHKIHELQELGKSESRASPSKGSPDVTSAGRDKVREVSKSPPPQRHLHTHYHSHVVGPAPPVYPLCDPYSAAIMTQAATGTASSIGHSYVPK